MQFRKKPVVIEATQMPTSPDHEAARKVAEWMADHGYREHGVDMDDTDPDYIYGDIVLPVFGANFLEIPTPEGDMRADLGDWIIRGVQGEFYPCKPDIFAATYEPVEVKA